MAALNVLVTTPVYIDNSIFELWLQANSVERAVAVQQQRFPQVDGSLVMEDVMHQFRLYEMMEHFLKRPRYLAGQLLFQLSATTQQQLIDRYYDFDAPVLRELLGKKLTSRLRKDLDDISEKTQVSLRSCRRQFDNLKRIFKEVEDQQDHPHPVYDVIQKTFLLSPEATRTYARAIFICYYKLDTTKRRLAYLSFGHYEFCAGMLMAQWTIPGRPLGEDLDRYFLQELRDLKLFFTSDILNEFLTLVYHQLKQHTALYKHRLEALPTNFKPIIRSILSIGAGLPQSKEFRDIFIDIEEKVLDTFRDMEWGPGEVEQFFVVFQQNFDRVRMDSAQYKKYKNTFDRFFTAMAACCVKLYS
eukprot:Colp12_sorted_trinity150504_noHs@1146